MRRIIFDLKCVFAFHFDLLSLSGQSDSRVSRFSATRMRQKMRIQGNSSGE